MLSIAISTDVNPAIMVNFSKLFGDLGLLLIKDSEESLEYL